MERRKPLRRKTPLRNVTPLKRKPKRRSAEERIASQVWIEHVCHPRARCIVCGRLARETPERKLQGHHVLTQQFLRRLARRLGLDEVRIVWDVRNGAAICERDHTRHTTKFRPIRQAMIPPAAREFAEELGVTWKLEREYIQ